MSDDNKPAAIMATTGQVKTMADGTLRITVEVPPGVDAKTAFSLFGFPGTPIALARIAPEVVMQQQRSETIAAGKGPHGQAYVLLHKIGFFYAPELHKALKIDGEIAGLRALHEKDGAIMEFVKGVLYEKFGVSSLSEIDPDKFRAGMMSLGVGRLLPSSFE